MGRRKRREPSSSPPLPPASSTRHQSQALGRRFAAALLPRLFGTNPMSHHKGGFEPETNGFQFYAIANLDKTSLIHTLHTFSLPPPHRRVVKPKVSGERWCSLCAAQAVEIYRCKMRLLQPNTSVSCLQPAESRIKGKSAQVAGMFGVSSKTLESKMGLHSTFPWGARGRLSLTRSEFSTKLF